MSTPERFKFEELEVWKLALEYLDVVYDLTAKLPRDEDFNLKSQMRRAATSIGLNIAEGSTGQSNAEQARFIGMALRSLIETVACLRIIQRRDLCNSAEVDALNVQAHRISAMLQAFRKSLEGSNTRVSEDSSEYRED